MKYVVVVGTPFGGKTIHGPFDNVEDAQEWVDKWAVEQPYDILDLHDHGVYR